jgi:hypothetical protein
MFYDIGTSFQIFYESLLLSVLKGWSLKKPLITLDEMTSLEDWTAMKNEVKDWISFYQDVSVSIFNRDFLCNDTQKNNIQYNNTQQNNKNVIISTNDIEHSNNNVKQHNNTIHLVSFISLSVLTAVSCF